jgi:predicted dehydrogenase
MPAISLMILGEVCHFLDFLLYMAEPEPVQVLTAAISGATGKYRPDDNLGITLTCKGVSVDTIIYTAKDSKSFSRNHFEVFCEDLVVVIEDFRLGQLVQGSRTRQIKKLSMDMGYVKDMDFFFRQAAAPEPDPGLFQSVVATTRATLGAVESLRSGKAVLI